MSSSKIVLLTGGIETGKTRLCLAISQEAREAGVRVAGVLSPAVFEGGKKIGIDLLDPKTGQQRRLAVLKERAECNLQTRRWSFIAQTVDWGSQLLKESIPCDLLLVDELGPIEFDRNQGWVEAFAAVDSGLYSTALLVIRPSLLERARERWEEARIIDLDDPGRRPISPRSFLEGENLLPGT